MRLTRQTTGLTLGKFAPLHRGHQLVLETALEENDHVAALIYDCPEVTDVPLPTRAAWLRKLYPQVQVIQAWGGPQEMGRAPHVQRAHEDYIAGLLRKRGIERVSRFYSSEFYGDHVSRALGAKNRVVDEARRQVPISATVIRRHPFAHREWLHPLVYRDLVTNVVLLGGPSTGKTTLAAQLAQQYRTVWMPEYGREYWAAHQVNRRLTPAQLAAIAEGHLEREERMLWDADRFLFTDTNALTTFVFALDYHGEVLPRLAELAAQTAARYDVVLLCDEDFPFDDTQDRSGEGQRQEFQKQTRAELIARKIPFFMVSGHLEARVRRVRAILEAHRKYQPLDL